MRLHAPHVALWTERMVSPISTGDWEEMETLWPTLQPLVATQVSLFLKWADAISDALASGQKALTVDLGGGKLWEQQVGGPQR